MCANCTRRALLPLLTLLDSIPVAASNLGHEVPTDLAVLVNLGHTLRHVTPPEGAADFTPEQQRTSIAEARAGTASTLGRLSVDELHQLGHTAREYKMAMSIIYKECALAIHERALNGDAEAEALLVKADQDSLANVVAIFESSAPRDTHLN
jgi:hypothetical protein